MCNFATASSSFSVRSLQGLKPTRALLCKRRNLQGADEFCCELTLSGAARAFEAPGRDGEFDTSVETRRVRCDCWHHHNHQHPTTTSPVSDEKRSRELESETLGRRRLVRRCALRCALVESAGSLRRFLKLGHGRDRDRQVKQEAGTLVRATDHKDDYASEVLMTTDPT